MSPVRRRLAVAAAAVLTAAAVLGGGAAATADPAAPPGIPTAQRFDGVPTVGPLFRHGLAGDHGCTASVVASRSRDLLITAAHCVSGTGAGTLFAPGYRAGATPEGVWEVVAAYVDPSWGRSQAPQHDVAVLRVAPRRIAGRLVRVQDVTGAERLAAAPRPGSRIEDVAYDAGRDDLPIRCGVATYRFDGYPAFDCHGFVGGSSGSPWLTRAPGSGALLVRGVIGGLHQGGCFEYTSYSSRFGGDEVRLLRRADRGGPSDVVPEAGGDGC